MFISLSMSCVVCRRFKSEVLLFSQLVNFGHWTMRFVISSVGLFVVEISIAI